MVCQLLGGNDKCKAMKVSRVSLCVEVGFSNLRYHDQFVDVEPGTSDTMKSAARAAPVEGSVLSHNTHTNDSKSLANCKNAQPSGSNFKKNLNSMFNSEIQLEQPQADVTSDHQGETMESNHFHSPNLIQSTPKR